MQEGKKFDVIPSIVAFTLELLPLGAAGVTSVVTLRPDLFIFSINHIEVGHQTRYEIVGTAAQAVYDRTRARARALFNYTSRNVV